VEWRHASPALLDEMERALLALAQDCAAAANVTAETRQLAHIPAAQMAQGVTDAIERACKIVGVTHTRMASYASHNAQVMSAFTPSGMLFIPSLNGLSHNPEEYSRWEDVVKGANVLLHAILDLAAQG
jgi:N-carbamoyl-L-amino-acid hydrolase